MENDEKLKSIFDTNSEFKKHFVLKVFELKKGLFFGLGLSERSSGKELESIIVLFDEILNKIEDLGFINIVFSLKEVSYFSDLGLSIVVRHSIKLEEKGGKLIIIEPSRKIKDTIEILGLDKIWPIFDSEKEFIEEMNK